MFRSAVFACGTLAALAAGCADFAPTDPILSSQQGQLSGKLVITGSSTCAPVTAEIARRFEQQHPHTRIDVQTGGSARGVEDARRGLADIGMVSRDLKPEESDLLAFPFAKDGICMIVHRENTIAELTDEQIVAVYTGRIDNWRQFGGSDGPITVVNKAAGRSTLELFVRHFQLKSADIKPHVVIGDNEQGVKTVAGNPHAIGYVSIGAAQYDALHGVAIKLLPIGGVEASLDKVADGSFPLSRTLNFVVRDEPAGLTAAFLDFARSAIVHDLLQEQYFVPLAK